MTEVKHSGDTVSTVELNSRVAFNEIKERAKNQPSLVKKLGGIILFDITKDGKFQQSWTIDGQQGIIYEGKPHPDSTAQVTITVDDNDFMQLALGKANAPALFAKGKLKIKGNIMMAQKLSTIFRAQSKL